MGFHSQKTFCEMEVPTVLSAEDGSSVPHRRALPLAEDLLRDGGADGPLRRGRLIGALWQGGWALRRDVPRELSRPRVRRRGDGAPAAVMEAMEMARTTLGRTTI